MPLVTLKGILGVEARSVWSEGCGLACLALEISKKDPKPPLWRTRLQGCLITHAGKRA